jgi:DNA-directed RNA polymerase specialized sigma24 family protein
LVTLEAIAKRHTEWLKIANYLGATPDQADDMVQSMYLKLAEIQLAEGDFTRLTNHHGTINTIYLFKMLHNAFMDIKRAEKHTIPHQDHFVPVESPEMAEMAHSDLMGEVKNSVTMTKCYWNSILCMGIA